MVTVTKELLEQGISRNGAWSATQLRALNVPIGRRFKLIKGWKDRLIGSEITEQQKNRFLDLKDKHIKNINTEPLFDEISLEHQHMQEIGACLR